MKNRLTLCLVVIVAAFLVQACGGGGGGGGSSSTQVQTSAVAPVGEAGDLLDLGDLVMPEGDHWYYTQAVGLNDNGTVIGSSNNNAATTKGAFRWVQVSATEGEMTYLGISPGMTFSVAVDVNNSEEVIVNSTGEIPFFDWSVVDLVSRSTSVWRDGVLTPVPDLVLPPNVAGVSTVYSPYKSNDINERGEIVGCAQECKFLKSYPIATPVVLKLFIGMGKQRAAVFLEKFLERTTPEAVAINENKQVVINSAGTVIFHDLNHEVVESLNQLPGADKTVAVDINDSIYTNNDDIADGHVIGNSGNFSDESLSYAIFGKSGLVLEKMTSFTPIDGGGGGGDDQPAEDTPECLGLDEWATDVKGFFWDGGAMYPVSDLGGGASAVTDINNKDQVVGGALTANGETHAILWTLGPDEKGVIQDLGTLGGDHSFALGINEEGQIVGWSSTGEFYTEDGFNEPIIHGFLWDDGVMYDLGTHNYFYDYPFVPSFPYSAAVDINEHGELTGNSMTINSHSRGFFYE